MLTQAREPLVCTYHAENYAFVSGKLLLTGILSFELLKLDSSESFIYKLLL